MIETKNLIKKYNDITVLNLPDFKIHQGEHFGLVGNNGAGKTTFFSLVLDLIEASEGAVFSGGKNVRQSEHGKRYTGAYLDERFLIDFLTPEEYFAFIGQLHRLSPAAMDNFFERFRDFFNGEILGKKKYLRDFSWGNQKKVGIAAAMMGQPEILVLDEPFPHLDPTTVIRLKKILQQLKTTLLISSHDLNHVTEICSRIAILEKGEIVHDLQTSADTLTQLHRYFEVK